MTVSRETGLQYEAEVSALLGTPLVCLTGSLATDGFGNDADILVLYPDFDEAHKKLCDAGYTSCMAGTYGDGQRSVWRKGDINVILCFNAAEYRRWLASLNLCLELVLQYGYTTKEIRAEVHKKIRGEYLE